MHARGRCAHLVLVELLRQLEPARLRGLETFRAEEANDVDGQTRDLGAVRERAERGHVGGVRERVEQHIFEFPAGSFFQNNNAILPSLVSYARDAIAASDPAPTHLVDAYCGSGLFSVTLAGGGNFERVVGVEIDENAIKAARANAARNGLPPDRCAFTAGKAEAIFASVLGVFPPERTAVVIDPPRRGCDEAFILQLVKLAPRTVVYVSCNVHTQARDVGSILRKDPAYKVLSIRGADLFPQTK